MINIEVDENISVKNISSFKELVEGAVKKDNISLDFKNIHRTDLSFMQVIYALRLEASANKKKIKLLNVSHELKTQMVICGIVKDK